MLSFSFHLSISYYIYILGIGGRGGWLTHQLLDRFGISVHARRTETHALVGVGAMEDGDLGEAALRNADLGIFFDEGAVDGGEPFQADVCGGVDR